jgi:hypothetical protein
MNPAGFSYAGYALKDCIKGAGRALSGAAMSSSSITISETRRLHSAICNFTSELFYEGPSRSDQWA